MKFSLTAALVLLIIGALLSDTNAASHKFCKGKNRKNCCLYNRKRYLAGTVVQTYKNFGLQLICVKNDGIQGEAEVNKGRPILRLSQIVDDLCSLEIPIPFKSNRSKKIHALKRENKKRKCKFNGKKYNMGDVVIEKTEFCFQLICSNAMTFEERQIPNCVCSVERYGYVWDYHRNGRQAPWPSYYKHCSGKRQTPIKILEKDVKQEQSLGKFNFFNYDKVPNKATLHNDSDDVRYYIETPDEDRPYITGGGLQSEYVFYQMHFHWGSEDDGGRGAEHELDDQIYPITVHFIHFKREYKDYNTAREKPDGLAVFGFPCKIVEEDNEKLSNLVDVLKEIEEYDATVEVETKPLFEYLGRTNEYYRYDGSAATPPCFESVTWSVFFTGYPMSQRQLDLFRKYPKTRFGDNISGNFRELQPLNDRVVYKYTESFLEETTTTGPPTTSPPTTHPNYTPL